jgi:hypothetical protein
MKSTSEVIHGKRKIKENNYLGRTTKSKQAIDWSVWEIYRIGFVMH